MEQRQIKRGDSSTPPLRFVFYIKFNILVCLFLLIFFTTDCHIIFFNHFDSPTSFSIYLFVILMLGFSLFLELIYYYKGFSIKKISISIPFLPSLRENMLFYGIMLVMVLSGLDWFKEWEIIYNENMGNIHVLAFLKMMSHGHTLLGPLRVLIPSCLGEICCSDGERMKL